MENTKSYEFPIDLGYAPKFLVKTENDNVK